jgi:hypothetical protein
MPNPSTSNLIDGLMDAASRNDPVGVRGELDAALGALGLGACIDDVLLPVMRRIGNQWQQGQWDIETERLTTETVRAWLEVRLLSAPEPGPAAAVLLACGPRDQHSIALEALGLLLRNQAQSCRMLGPRTSIRSLTVAIAANRPSGIVVVSHLRSSRLGATQALRSIASPGPPLFYAGDAFATRRLRRNVPGTYLGTNIQAASRAILRATAAH